MAEGKEIGVKAELDQVLSYLLSPRQVDVTVVCLRSPVSSRKNQWCTRQTLYRPKLVTAPASCPGVFSSLLLFSSVPFAAYQRAVRIDLAQI